MLLPEDFRIFLSVTSFEPGYFCLVEAIFGCEFGISSCFTGLSLVAQLLIELRALSLFSLKQSLVILQIDFYFVFGFIKLSQFVYGQKLKKTVPVTEIWTVTWIHFWLQSFVMLVVWCCSAILTYVSIYVSLSFLRSLLASSRSGQKATSRGRRKRRRRGRARLSSKFTAQRKTAL